jgi:hypothetical protein
MYSEKHAYMFCYSMELSMKQVKSMKNQLLISEDTKLQWHVNISAS